MFIIYTTRERHLPQQASFPIHQICIDLPTNLMFSPFYLYLQRHEIDLIEINDEYLHRFHFLLQTRILQAHVNVRIFILWQQRSVKHAV